jgi:hypothetical protein
MLAARAGIGHMPTEDAQELKVSNPEFAAA